MNLCVLSGKGGTGKTTVAVNLAVLLKAEYYDCDVEEPNGFLFLRPPELRRSIRLWTTHLLISPSVRCADNARGHVSSAPSPPRKKA